MMRTQSQLHKTVMTEPVLLTRHHVYGVLFLFVVFSGLIFLIYDWQYGKTAHENATQVRGEVCAQVIARAQNPQTGEVREFPTPCDVPAGWSRINDDVIQ